MMEKKQPTIANGRGPEATPQAEPAAPFDPKLEYDPEILREGWLRAAAELDNLRKRIPAEIGAARKDERITLLRAILDVVDNFERALASDEAARSEDQFVAGVQAVYFQLLAVLKGFGAEPIDARGELFDPTYHEAVRMVELSHKPPGVVAEVLQAGYRMSDGSLLRPAKVTVVQPPQHSA